MPAKNRLKLKMKIKIVINTIDCMKIGQEKQESSKK